jgi:hypothetical protein
LPGAQSTTAARIPPQAPITRESNRDFCRA